MLYLMRPCTCNTLKCTSALLADCQSEVGRSALSRFSFFHFDSCNEGTARRALAISSSFFSPSKLNKFHGLP